MPNTYYPNATIPTVGTSNGAVLGILSSVIVAGGAVQVTTTLNGSTAGAHDLSTGDNVEIVGHVAASQLNGLWQITVTGTSTFVLNGSVWVGNGGVTGNVRTTTIDPAFTLPSGGDAVTATSVGAIGEMAGNAIPFLYLQTGKYRLVDQYYASNYGTGTPWVNWGGTPGTTDIALVNTPQAVSRGCFGGSYGGYVNPPGLLFGDILDITLTTDANVTVGGTFSAPAWAIQLGLGVAINGGGVTYVTGSAQSLGSSFTAAAVTYVPKIHLRNTYEYTNASTVCSSFDFFAMGNVYNVGSGAPSSTIEISPSSVFACIVNHYRLNGNEPGI